MFRCYQRSPAASGQKLLVLACLPAIWPTMCMIGPTIMALTASEAKQDEMGL
jgi:hypothetical protein